MNRAPTSDGDASFGNNSWMSFGITLHHVLRNGGIGNVSATVRINRSKQRIGFLNEWRSLSLAT